MQPDDQKYYDSLFEMYGTDGWRALMKDLEAHAKIYDSIQNVSVNHSLEFQKGRLDETQFLLKHEEIMKAAYDKILGEESADL